MPFKTGDQLTLTIQDIAFGGEGVGRAGMSSADAVSADAPILDPRPSTLDSFVVFVPFVLVGEVVEVAITEVKKNFARAKLLRVVQPSPERVTPACRYFGQCGGCQYQHIDYAAQLRLKHKQIADLFQRVGGFEQARIAPVIASPRSYGYRNRIMIRSQWNKPEQKLNIGFVRGDCGLVEDIEECQIAEPALNEEIRRVRAHPPPKGGIKVVLRVAPENWDVPPDRFSKTIFPCCRNSWKPCADCFATAAQGICWTCIVASVFLALNWRTRSNRSWAWNRPARHSIGAAQRGGAKHPQRGVHRRGGGGDLAGGAEAVFPAERRRCCWIRRAKAAGRKRYSGCAT